MSGTMCLLPLYAYGVHTFPFTVNLTLFSLLYEQAYRIIHSRYFPLFLHQNCSCLHCKFTSPFNVRENYFLYIFLLRNLQIGCGAYQATRQWIQFCCFPWTAFDPSPHLLLRLRICVALPPFLLMPSWREHDIFSRCCAELLKITVISITNFIATIIGRTQERHCLGWVLIIRNILQSVFISSLLGPAISLSTVSLRHSPTQRLSFTLTQNSKPIYPQHSTACQCLTVPFGRFRTYPFAKNQYALCKPVYGIWQLYKVILISLLTDSYPRRLERRPV